MATHRGNTMHLMEAAASFLIQNKGANPSMAVHRYLFSAPRNLPEKAQQAQQLPAVSLEFNAEYYMLHTALFECSIC